MNANAVPVWTSRCVPFAERQARCKEIVSRVVGLNKVTGGNFQPPSKLVVEELGNIFNRFYGSLGTLLLIGRTDEVYEVQDRYACEVSVLLEFVNPRYQSQASTNLQKVYGRGSLPLLCISSVSGIWQLCRLPFYKSQISLISSPGPACLLPH